MVNAAIGIWLMAAPAVLGYGAPSADNERIFGPLIATFSIIAIWEVTRALRWANVAFGFWLLLAPWVLGAPTTSAVANEMAAGIVVMALSLVKGKIKSHYGGGWTVLWKGFAGR
jgi:hypothetical protein